MINLFRWYKKGYIWVLLVLLFVNACQPAPIIVPSIQPTSTQLPTIELTSTEVAAPLPTFGLPTATPIATKVASILTPNGPWLVYLRYGLTIVNQDGTGLTTTGRPDERSVCNLDGIQENQLNRVVIFPKIVYLVQPQPTWKLVFREWPTCHTDFTGNEKSGLLANIYQSTSDAIPELRIYELPSGRLRDHFLLMKCSEQCNTDNVNWWEIKWSPNGRYLAFPATLEGDSSDLYIYDSQNGDIQKLTTGPDHVGTIWWSPDGNTIIMSEILKDDEYPYASSVWAVSVNNSEIKLLYFLNSSYPQGLLGWLDNSRFVTYDGTNLLNALDLPAYNLRVVDKGTGKVTVLFKGGFMATALDQAHETVVIYASGEVFIVSTSNPEPKLMRGVLSTPWWDDGLRLFVTDDPCENDPKGKKAFDYKGEWHCVYYELLPESLSSPDGTWQVLLHDGFWLKTNDQQPVRVSEGTPTQIIWRLDSQGLFFIVNSVLYYTSLPNVDITIIDKYPGGESIYYQWVGGD